MHTDRLPRLLEQVRERIRYKQYSYRTEQTYVQWIRRFILFHGKRHPKEMGAPETARYLTHLAARRDVSASTQNQALCALLFLYREVLTVDLPWIDGFQMAKRPQRLPVVMAREEVAAVLAHLDGVHWLMASLLYGSGLRSMECLRLRVKEIDFDRRELLVRHGKGGKDRVTMLPSPLIEPLRRQLTHAKFVHERDLREGFGAVYLPFALARKYPNANRSWAWR
jgi:integron integrase